MRNYIIIGLIAYLCGSIPFGYILVRIFKGEDVRQSGSGNIGATNVARTAPLLGIATLLLDGIKGYVPVKYILWQGTSFFPDALRTHELLAVAAVCVIFGHLFPVWLKFRGGKGVATAVGIYLALAPRILGLSFVVFLLVFLITRYVSVGSISAAAAFPLLAYFVFGMSWPQPVFIAMIAISLLVILRHHSNIRKLLHGTEDKFTHKRPIDALATED